MNVNTGEFTALRDHVDELDRILLPKLIRLGEQLDQLKAELPTQPVPPLRIIDGEGQPGGPRRGPKLSLVPPVGAGE